VGQNLGAKQPERAEKSVWKTAQYNAIFMGIVSLLFITCAEFFVRLIDNSDPAVIKNAVLGIAYC
jgi:Na+-driven multidrug efflux pump